MLRITRVLLRAAASSTRIAMCLAILVVGVGLVPRVAHAQGAITNGANHSGTIATPGQVDTWTFSATAGDLITLSIGEREPTVGFNPWIRLFAPDASSAGSSTGVLSAQINDHVALQTGTYTVLVSAHAGAPSGTGSYVLVLAKVPGALTVSPGDQGGALTNGANHSGEITLGDVDAWTFIASIGDNITLSIGEVEPTANFNPWIRLIGPTGAQLGSATGVLSTQINNEQATSTGTYTVIVSSHAGAPSGTGNYVLTVAKVPGTPTVSPGDQGGALANGANQAGEITLGDLDSWTFAAGAGDSITLSIGEVEPTVSFNAWIRLHAPDGTVVGNSTGVLSAQINTVQAPQAGTYTVVVSAHAGAPSGTGHYVLTLARVPGAFTISPGDQGGRLAIGTAHPGEILLGDVDRWTFYAAPGDALAITIGEVEPTNSFNPWIRLIGPAGEVVAQATSTVATQINIAAPKIGLYSILVSAHAGAPSGTGNYLLTVTGVTTPNALSEMAVDFGPGAGLWLRTNHGAVPPQAASWQQLHSASPSVMATGRIDNNPNDDLVVTFPGFGVWIWMNNAGWVQLHGLDATDIVTADLNGNGLDEIVLNFPGFGVWIRYDNGTWTQLHSLNSSALAAGRIDVGPLGDLVINFPGAGVWLFLNNAAWVQLHSFNASDIQIGNLDGNSQDDIILNFAGLGLWVRFNNSSWFHLSSLNSAGLAAGNIDGDPAQRQDLIVNFPGAGVWAYMNNATWFQLHGLNAPVLATRDLDFNGVDEVILNFPGHGIWIRVNNLTIVQLHGLDAQAIATGRFDVN